MMLEEAPNAVLREVVEDQRDRHDEAVAQDVRDEEAEVGASTARATARATAPPRSESRDGEERRRP